MAKEGNVAIGIAECSDRSYLWSVSAMALCCWDRNKFGVKRKVGLIILNLGYTTSRGKALLDIKEKLNNSEKRIKSHYLI